MSNSPVTIVTNNTTLPPIGHTMTVNTGGPFGGAGTITLQGSNSEHEQMSIDDLRMFKEMCELLDYIGSVDPKFAEYMAAFKAKKRILR
jgi:hypothetical protein